MLQHGIQGKQARKVWNPMPRSRPGRRKRFAVDPTIRCRFAHRPKAPDQSKASVSTFRSPKAQQREDIPGAATSRRRQSSTPAPGGRAAAIRQLHTRDDESRAHCLDARGRRAGPHGVMIALGHTCEKAASQAAPAGFAARTRTSPAARQIPLQGPRRRKLVVAQLGPASWMYRFEALQAVGPRSPAAGSALSGTRIRIGAGSA